MQSGERTLLYRFPKVRRSLLPLLTEVQREEGFLSEASIREVGRHLGLTDNEVYGVASFYPWFRFASSPKAEPAAPPGFRFGQSLPDGESVVVCNAAAGEPGGVDRFLLESEPEALLEGLALEAKRLGFRRAVVWVDVEWPTAAERVARAFEQAREDGLLIEVARVPGALMHRERSAFRRAFEGWRPIAEPQTAEGEVAVYTAADLVRMTDSARPGVADDRSSASGAASVLGEIPAAASAGGCAVDRTARTLDYLSRHLCGKCAICREGTLQMAEILRDLKEGKGKAADLELLGELGEALAATGSCALGRASPQGLLSTLQNCRDEYEAHLKQNRCLSGRCNPGREE